MSVGSDTIHVENFRPLIMDFCRERALNPTLLRNYTIPCHLARGTNLTVLPYGLA